VYLVFGLRPWNLKTIGIEAGNSRSQRNISPFEDVSTHLIFPLKLNYTRTLAVVSVTLPITGPTLMDFY